MDPYTLMDTDMDRETLCITIDAKAKNEITCSWHIVFRSFFSIVCIVVLYSLKDQKKFSLFAPM